MAVVLIEFNSLLPPEEPTAPSTTTEDDDLTEVGTPSEETTDGENGDGKEEESIPKVTS